MDFFCFSCKHSWFGNVCICPECGSKDVTFEDDDGFMED